MRQLFLMGFSIFLLIGCAHHTTRKGVLSQELPLTLSDLAEIRAGETNHKKVMEEYRRYESPKLETYLNAIAASVAAVSTRPHLPYRVIILDSDEVNIFGGPGGFVYISRGLLNFVNSESEVAGIIAHEVGHISSYEYAGIPQHAKIKFVYNNLLRGSEFAKSSIGSYGTAVNVGLKGLGVAAPAIARQFGRDEEIIADEKALDYLKKAGYDPRGFQQFVDRLARVPMEDVGRFVTFMNTHPPFQDRRRVLNEKISQIDFSPGKIEFKKDLLSEVRQMTLNAPDSIVFEPQLGVHEAASPEIDQLQSTKQEEKLTPSRSRRWGWF